jgi:ketosteroid isomerase-like protein
MSEDAATVVRAMTDAYNARDMDALLALFHPQVEWHTTPGFLWPGPYRGVAALRRLFEHWWLGWDTGQAEHEELVARQDEAMLTAHIHGRSAGSGEDVEVRLNWVFHLRGGLIDLVRSYDTPAKARSALG